MRKHAQFWAEKTETCRRIYETQARMRTAAKRGEISEELEAVRSQIALLEGRILEEAQRRGSIQLSDATLDAHALGLFSNLWKSSRFQDEAVASKRQQAMCAPEPWRGDAGENELGHEPGAGEARGPAFLGQICARRANFANTALMWQSGDEQVVCKFMFARCEKYFVALCRLTKIDPGVGCVEVAGDTWEAISRCAWRRAFRSDFYSLESLSRWPELRTEDVLVLPGLVFTRGVNVGSDAWPVPLETWLKRVPPDGPERLGDSSRSATRNATAKLPDTLPAWVRDHLCGGGSGFGSQRGKRPPAGATARVSGSSSESSADEPPAELDDDLVKQIFADVENKRTQMAEEMTKPPDDDFKVRLLAGQSVYKRTGESFTAYVGEARGQLARQFCVSLKEHSSATYTISIYGDHAAALLARSWCRVMQHFFNLHIASGTTSFTADQRNAYTESTELAALEAGTTSRDINKRITQIRALFRKGVVD